MKSFSILAKNPENLPDLKPCIHGGEIWDIHKKTPYKGKIIDFSSNINPIGPSKKALQAVRRCIREIPYYPDSNSTALRDAIAKHFKIISKENVIAGNGSTELIYLFAEAFLNKGDVAIIPIPTFSEYARAVRKTGASIKYIKPGNQLRLDVTAFKRALPKAKVAFLCNPNNPTGALIRQQNLISILERAIEEDCIVFLDEDFIEFVEDEKELSMINQIRKFPNLFILRSFTKIFALTGLRVGYGVSSEEIVNTLLYFKIPWNVNCIAQTAAIEALADAEHIEITRQLVKTERVFLTNALRQIKGFTVFPSATNFILVDIHGSGFTAAHLKKKMLQYNILIRDCSSFTGLNDYYIRVAIKTHRENEMLVETFRKILLHGSNTKQPNASQIIPL
ncbi:MAG: threonine-phosphate decarboxylase CobD [Candidatus Bathyarchaeia archaeon]